MHEFHLEMKEKLDKFFIILLNLQGKINKYIVENFEYSGYTKTTNNRIH